ncbi:DHA2 family efflux MFS transporter permease subunit [Sphingomonas sp. SRS2]|uniref:DHA2 family efflux MFS transporter permease subunit n=1 Tax=Sphingomonas sp. SRS2 TaxID=133190 RepID=UPI0006184771|nr:DHA2 family efflux MFS transporter permease subunit [Sphingomonas sp. SRS2]KKC26791.1 EmrB/QacA family drug resistance transporter [Sphingomonas sp. SRS2]
MATVHSADVAAVPVAPVPKAIATALIMAATILVVLDQTIATVALPHMQAALGATPETINWVLTSYILATSVGIPLTGWLSGRVGRGRLFGICILGFTISSALCGLAVSLPMMVAARLAQGFFGAFLVPMSQSFLYDMNAPSQQMRAMTLWGVGVMVGPLVGPVLGGYLTETFDWRWVFFINVPIGLVAGLGILATMPAFPAVRRAFDHVGFILIVVALCALQLALDRGSQLDWFDSTEIVIECGVSIAAFWMLIFHLWHAREPIFSISLFRDRAFSIALLLSLVVTPVMIAATALLPALLQTLLGYPVTLAGLLSLPRGIAMLIGIIIGGRLFRIIGARAQVAMGLAFTAFATWLQTRINLEMDSHLIIWAGMAQGLGTGVALTVLNFLTVAHAPTAFRTDAAVLYNLARNTGASIMIAAFTAILARNIQVNHAEIGAAIGATNVPLGLSQMAGGPYLTNRLAALIDAEVTRQSMMIAYINDFWLMMWLTILVMPLALLLGRERPRQKPDEMMIVE